MKSCVVPALTISVLAIGSVWAGGPSMVEIEPSKDNTLYEDPDGALSNGAGSRMFVGVTGQQTNNRRRGLIEFDVAGSVPAGSVITGVTLRMALVNVATSDGVAVSLHRALQEWGEGSSFAAGGQGAGATASDGDATWLHSEFSSVLWSSPGGDFDLAASASTVVSVPELPPFTWSGPGIVADVQSWLDDPLSNAGWLLLADEDSGTNAKVFATGEHPESSVRPSLTITYVPTPGALALALIALPIAFGRRRSVRQF